MIKTVTHSYTKVNKQGEPVTYTYNYNVERKRGDNYITAQSITAAVRYMSNENRAKVYDFIKSLGEINE